MTRLEALKALKEAVDAGEENRFAHSFLDEVRAWRSPLEYFDVCNQVHAAYHGSLDAARALHEAVLPEWGAVVCVSGKWAEVWPINVGVFSIERHEALCPARAWLIGIISALIAQEADQ